MEMSKLIPELAQRFELSFADPNHDWTVHNNWLVSLLACLQIVYIAYTYQ